MTPFQRASVADAHPTSPEKAMRLAPILTLAVAAWTSAAPGHAAPGPEDRAVLIGEEAVLLFPPEVAAPAVVEHGAWSSSGSHLLLVRQSIPFPGRPGGPETAL